MHGLNVGAGLLANAVCQATQMLNVSPHSRASRIVAPPLPQGVVSALRFELKPDTQWLSCSSPHNPASCRYPRYTGSKALHGLALQSATPR
ncbi:hypothetical protein EYC95_02030 [Pseudomonas sp. BGI-2]|nr:hypothetical protein EYC95_02030 [Pseudomonas sp. BGI-2]